MSGRINRFFNGFFSERFFLSPERERLNRMLNWGTLMMLATVFSALVLIYHHGPAFHYDTFTYEHAAVTLSQGEVDLWRTPLYPYLILFFRYLFGSAGPVMLCVFQQLLFLLSVMLLRHILRIAGTGRRTGIILTAFYLFVPYLVSWWYMCHIATELVSCFLFMLLGWLSIRIIVNPGSLKISDALWIALLLFLMVAVRPANIYLLPVYALIWLIVIISPKWRTAAGLVGLAGVIAVSAAVWEYRSAIKSRYGYDGITIISYINNYHFVRHYGLMKPELVGNPELRRMLHDFNAFSDEDRYLPVNHYFNETHALLQIDSCAVEMQHVVNKALVHDPANTGRALTSRLRADVSSNLLTINPDRWIYVALVPYMPNMGCVYLFLLICLAGIIVMWIRRRRFPWLVAYLWGMVFTSHIAAMLGAMSDWARLTYGSFPFLLLLFAKALDCFISIVRSNR